MKLSRIPTRCEKCGIPKGKVTIFIRNKEGFFWFDDSNLRWVYRNGKHQGKQVNHFYMTIPEGADVDHSHLTKTEITLTPKSFDGNPIYSCQFCWERYLNPTLTNAKRKESGLRNRKIQKARNRQGYSARKYGAYYKHKKQQAALTDDKQPTA